jgi:tetratricopeptide (TPR) repeat protein
MADRSTHDSKTVTRIDDEGDDLKFNQPDSLVWALVLIAFAFIASNLIGDESRFDQANGLFEQGEFETAIVEYSSLIDAGIQTPAVHFNLGNAYFRQNNTGMAIYHYLMAQTLDPLDADVQANLKFTRESAGLPSGGISSPWRQWLRILPLNTWFLITLLPLWTYCLLKTFQLLTASTKGEGLRSASGWMIAPGVCLLAIIAWAISGQHVGVVITDKAPLHASPFSDSKNLGEMKTGEEVQLLAEKKQWRQIRNTKGELGWLEMSHLKAIPIY